MNVVTNPISVAQPLLKCQVNEMNLVVNATDLFSMTVSLIDSVSAQKLQNIAWKVNT